MATVAEALPIALRYHQSGDLREAERLYRQILDVRPEHADALHLLGVIAYQVGRHGVAVDYISKALALKPDDADYHCNRGVALHALGQLREAEDDFREALRLRPVYPEAYNNLGAVLTAEGRNDDASECYRQAALCKPGYPDELRNLGIALHRQGRLEEAEASLSQAVRLQPNADAYYHLGDVLHEQGKLDEAVATLRQAVHLKPEFAQGHYLLASMLAEQDQLVEAAAGYQQALRCQPDLAEAHHNLANVLFQQGQLDAAVASYREALRHKPAWAEAHRSLGSALEEQGLLQAAGDCYREALRLQPDDAAAHSGLLLAMNYDPAIDDDLLFAEHRLWAERHGAVAVLGPASNHDRNPDRRLRIGYVSSGFRRHPLTSFLEPILRHHDPSQVETIGYAEVPVLDAVSGRLQSLLHGWRRTSGMSDTEMADLIRRDGIDILVDLAGHTGGNRLRVFAHKPAPVQISYLGYPNTTGLATVDYRLTDAILDPPGEPVRHTEELIRLEAGFSCYLPPENGPAVAPLPARRTGYITFGSPHLLAQINAGVLDLWCAILRAQPGARLLLFRRALTGTMKDRLIQHFDQRGVGLDRLDIRLAPADPSAYLRMYAEIDICLDAFPYGGHSTVCEALWMGVPVVTLRGSRCAGRAATSVLTHMRVKDLIVDSQERYLAVALRLAEDVDRLALLRARLRDCMRASPVCDGETFTRGLERTYRVLWRRWCG